MLCRLVCTYEPEEIKAMALTQMKETAKVSLGKKANHEVCGEVESRFKEVESRSEVVESRFEEEDSSETLTRAKLEEMNRDLFKETLKPIKQVHEEADLAKREIDEIVGSPTRIPTVQSDVGGYSRGRNQERKGEMGDDMRCLYTTVTVQRSVHGGEQCRTTIWTVCRIW